MNTHEPRWGGKINLVLHVLDMSDPPGIAPAFVINHAWRVNWFAVNTACCALLFVIWKGWL